MDITIHQIGNLKIAEVHSEKILVASPEDGLQMLGDLYYQEFDGLILNEQNIAPDFFDLRTGIAGEILQKFANYRFRLAIIGDFEKYESKALRDFVFESNKGKHVNFRNSLQEALAAF